MTRGDDMSPPPDEQGLVGTWRRFGAVGPVYEILGYDHRGADGKSRPGVEQWFDFTKFVKT